MTHEACLFVSSGPPSAHNEYESKSASLVDSFSFHSLIHSFPSFIHSFIHSSIYSLTHSFILTFFLSFVQPSVHPSLFPGIHSSSHPFIHAFTYSFYELCCSGFFRFSVLLPWKLVIWRPEPFFCQCEPLDFFKLSSESHYTCMLVYDVLVSGLKTTFNNYLHSFSF